mgnify:CR=1 FL=1
MKGKLPIIILIVAVVLGAAYVTGFLQKLLPFQEQLYFTADFTATPVVNQNHTVQFNVSISGGVAPYRTVWDFGDGNVTTQANPVHTYSMAGTYTVTLTVIDNTNVSRDATKAVTVT